MTDKIAIDRETLERVLECLVQEGRSLRAAEVREALEQNAEPPAPKDPVAQWQKRHHRGTEGKWENTDEHDAKWWRASSSLWDIRALYAAPQAWRPDIGEVVVTRNDAGEIVAVTRQDDEGRILSVIAEAQPSPAQEPALQEIADFGQEQELVAWLRFQEHENRPTTIHLCDSDHPKAFKVYAISPQPAPSQAKSLALLDLDSVEHMQGGANGPTIRLRGFINAQKGPTAPQPPIDNAFVAEGCEQFSQPDEFLSEPRTQEEKEQYAFEDWLASECPSGDAEAVQRQWEESAEYLELQDDTPAQPAPVPCCGKYEACSHACTPRGKWLGRREAESEIECLTTDLLSCRGTVKTELAHYERLALVHGKTVLAANYEAEAQRLSDLLDRIDAIATPTAPKG